MRSETKAGYSRYVSVPSLMQAQFIQEEMPVDLPLWDPLRVKKTRIWWNEDAQRDEAPLLWGQTERAGSVQPGDMTRWLC